MTQHFPLESGDVVHEGFFDPIQELLGASLPSLRIEVATASTLTIAAGVGNEQVTAALTNSTGTLAGFRWITSTINASLPGGLTNGTGSVYITASDNDFSGSVGSEDAATNYAFAMEIRASGTPSTDLWRKVGEVDVSGGSIIAFRAMGGPRPTSEFGLAATPDAASQPGLLVTGLSGQTGKLIEAKNSSGTSVYSVSNSGSTTQSGGITTSSADGVTISGSGGKDTLNLSNTDANTGITIGGDVEIYRAAANAIQTDDSVTIRRTSGSDTTLATKVTTDSQDRVAITAGGAVQIGSGSASPDVRLSRSGSSTVLIDTPSSGAAALSVTGGLTIGTTLTMTQATTAGHIPISNGSGLMTLGQAGAATLATDSVTTTKVQNSAISTAKIADNAVTSAKIASSTTEAVPLPSGYGATSSTITARKYADGQVTLSGVIVYGSWPGYFSSFTAFGNTWTVLELGTLPSGYCPTADVLTTGAAFIVSGAQVITTILILTTGEIAGRVNTASSATNPLRWGINATFHAA